MGRRSSGFSFDGVGLSELIDGVEAAFLWADGVTGAGSPFGLACWYIHEPPPTKTNNTTVEAIAHLHPSVLESIFLDIHVQNISTTAANTEPNVLFRIVMNQSSIAISLFFYRLFAIPTNHRLSPPSASSTYQVLSLDFEYP